MDDAFSRPAVPLPAFLIVFVYSMWDFQQINVKRSLLEKAITHIAVGWVCLKYYKWGRVHIILRSKKTERRLMHLIFFWRVRWSPKGVDLIMSNTKLMCTFWESSHSCIGYNDSKHRGLLKIKRPKLKRRATAPIEVEAHWQVDATLQKGHTLKWDINSEAHLKKNQSPVYIFMHNPNYGNCLGARLCFTHALETYRVGLDVGVQRHCHCRENLLRTKTGSSVVLLSQNAHRHAFTVWMPRLLSYIRRYDIVRLRLALKIV